MAAAVIAITIMPSTHPRLFQAYMAIGIFYRLTPKFTRLIPVFEEVWQVAKQALQKFRSGHRGAIRIPERGGDHAVDHPLLSIGQLYLYPLAAFVLI